MDFYDTPQEAEFRIRARDWLAANAPDLPEKPGAQAKLLLAEAKAWQAKKAAAGYACIKT